MVGSIEQLCLLRDRRIQDRRCDGRSVEAAETQEDLYPLLFRLCHTFDVLVTENRCTRCLQSLAGQQIMASRD
jgi:hypothetical protein